MLYMYSEMCQQSDRQTETHLVQWIKLSNWLQATPLVRSILSQHCWTINCIILLHLSGYHRDVISNTVNSQIRSDQVRIRNSQRSCQFIQGNHAGLSHPVTWWISPTVLYNNVHLMHPTTPVHHTVYHTEGQPGREHWQTHCKSIKLVFDFIWPVNL